MNANDTETVEEASQLVTVTPEPNVRGKMGRPTLYNSKTVTKLVNAVGDGLGLRAACIIAGIAYDTLMTWQREKPELKDKLDRAREQAALKHLNIIKAAAEQGDWRASESFLKLTRPEIFKRPQIQHETNYKTQVNAYMTLPPEEQERLRLQHERIKATTFTPAQRALRDAQEREREREPKRAAAVVIDPAPVAAAMPKEPRPSSQDNAEIIEAEVEPLPEPQQQPQPDSLRAWWERAEPTPTDDEPTGNKNGPPVLR